MRLWVMSCGLCAALLLLGACVAPVAEDVVVPEDAIAVQPTVTLGVPQMTVTTFTPTANGVILTQPGVSGSGDEVASDAAPVAPQAVIQYAVVAGDTLLGIALAHGVPMAAIQLQNDLGMETVVKVG